MAEYGVSTRGIVFAGLLGAILTAAVVMGLQVLYYRYEAGLAATEKFNQPPAKLEALLEKQCSRLMDYNVIDADSGVYAVPVDRAMELVVTELSQPKASRAAPIEPTAEGNRDEP